MRDFGSNGNPAADVIVCAKCGSQCSKAIGAEVQEVVKFWGGSTHGAKVFTRARQTYYFCSEGCRNDVIFGNVRPHGPERDSTTPTNLPPDGPAEHDSGPVDEEVVRTPGGDPVEAIPRDSVWGSGVREAAPEPEPVHDRTVVWESSADFSE